MPVSNTAAKRDAHTVHTQKGAAFASCQGTLYMFGSKKELSNGIFPLGGITHKKTQ